MAKTLSSLEPGDHLCLFYDTEAQHRQAMVTFLADGLIRGQRVLYLADTHTPAVLIDYLQDQPHLASALVSQQLQVLEAEDVYLTQGRFDVERMLERVCAELEQTTKAGYPALRVTGEMTWAVKNFCRSADLFEYESRVNDLYPGRPLIGLCQYLRRSFPPQALLETLVTHPLVVLGASLAENRHYLPPASYLNPVDRADHLDRLGTDHLPVLLNRLGLPVTALP